MRPPQPTHRDFRLKKSLQVVGFDLLADRYDCSAKNIRLVRPGQFKSHRKNSACPGEGAIHRMNNSVSGFSKS